MNDISEIIETLVRTLNRVDPDQTAHKARRMSELDLQYTCIWKHVVGHYLALVGKFKSALMIAARGRYILLNTVNWP